MSADTDPRVGDGNAASVAARGAPDRVAADTDRGVGAVEAPREALSAADRAAASAAAVSPLASAASIAAGFAANFFLGGLSAMALASLFPAEFPLGDPPQPTTLGLMLTTLAMGLNATVAGLLVGRLAPIAPVIHAAILAGLFGMFAMTGMDQAHGLPGWFALSFALVPPAACVAGGALARLGARRRAQRTPAGAPRGEATAVPTDPPAP